MIEPEEIYAAIALVVFVIALTLWVINAKRRARARVLPRLRPVEERLAVTDWRTLIPEKYRIE